MKNNERNISSTNPAENGGGWLGNARENGNEILSDGNMLNWRAVY